MLAASTMRKQILSKESLQRLILRESVGEWGCEDLTGVTVENCQPRVDGRNWKVTCLQNEDLPAAMHTVAAIAVRLGQQYDLAEDQKAR